MKDKETEGIELYPEESARKVPTCRNNSMPFKYLCACMCTVRAFAYMWLYKLFTVAYRIVLNRH